MFLASQNGHMLFRESLGRKWCLLYQRWHMQWVVNTEQFQPFTVQHVINFHSVCDRWTNRCSVIDTWIRCSCIRCTGGDMSPVCLSVALWAHSSSMIAPVAWLHIHTSDCLDCPYWWMIIDHSSWSGWEGETEGLGEDTVADSNQIGYRVDAGLSSSVRLFDDDYYLDTSSPTRPPIAHNTDWLKCLREILKPLPVMALGEGAIRSYPKWFLIHFLRKITAESSEGRISIE